MGVMLVHGKYEIEVKEVNDLSTDEAIAFARKLRDDDGVTAEAAYVDRIDGLVLVTHIGSWHFQTPLCGHDGSGPSASHEILEIFGFMPHDVEISQKLYLEK